VTRNANEGIHSDANASPASVVLRIDGGASNMRRDSRGGQNPAAMIPARRGARREPFTR
jgi:hypothetical protein